jgi:hypothetical protein
MLTITPSATLFAGADIQKRKYTSAQLTAVVQDGGAIIIGSDSRQGASEVTETLQGFSGTQGVSSSYLLIEVTILK